MTTLDPIPYQLESLIVTAFRTARERGKSDWRRMTIAVLKNRLLQLSRGAFDEKRHSASSFRELLERYPHLVHIDGGTAELAEQENPASASNEPDGQRIRPDLWRAIMDYSSGKKYTWDAITGTAREARSNETNLIPTISREDMAAWRTDFAAAHDSTPTLERWRNKTLTTSFLPKELQGVWNGFIRSKATERLQQWLSAQGIPVTILVPKESAAEQQTTTTDELRKTIILCINTMTLEELSEIKLPSTAVLRARLKGDLS
ncbi:hypothetical protein HJC10_36805 [Corallococcus exiguus]|nr:hypothetical protein [Corallococcus exiguus]